MKKMSLMAVALMLASVFCVAQNPQPRRNFQPKPAAERAAEFAAEYNLTADQTKALEKHFVYQDDVFKKLRENNANTDRNAVRAKMDSVRIDLETRLKEVIGVENFAKYQAKQEERRKEYQQRTPNGDRPQRPRNNNE